MSQADERAVRGLGFPLITGTLGTPYRVDKSDSLVQIGINGRLPAAFTDCDVVIADFTPKPTLPRPDCEPIVSEGEVDWWASCTTGVVDPRGRFASIVRPDLDRLLAHGASVVIFTDYVPHLEVHVGAVERVLGRQFSSKGKVDSYSPYGLLSCLRSFTFEAASGTEVSTVGSNVLTSAFSPLLTQASFRCIVDGPDDDLLPFLQDRFGRCVGGVLLTTRNQSDKPGWIFLLPQFASKADAIRPLFDEILPRLAPHLFPDSDVFSWVHDAPYEVQAVLQLEEQVARVRDNARREIEGLLKQIDNLRSEYSFIYDILTSTGTRLRLAVKQALEQLGLDVVDADQEPLDDSTPNLAEDLRIEGGTPLILVEVKGMAGFAKDWHLLQPTKHIAPTMKRRERLDVRALSVVNQQRNIPPLVRNNANPFPQKIIAAASRSDLGLITTWDLLRLLRSAQQNNWSNHLVREILSQNGRIAIVPPTYVRVGTVMKTWPQPSVISIHLTHTALQRGDHIALDCSSRVVELPASSMQVDHNDVATASKGALVGVQIPRDILHEVRKNTPVFCVPVSPDGPGGA